MSVSSGLSTVRGRERAFVGDAVNTTLNNMSYAELQTLKYNLYLKEVKRLGSVKEFKKKYPNFKIPPPPMNIAGIGGSVPGVPAIPTIVPTRELQLTATPAERQQEIDDIQTLRPNNLYISDFLNDNRQSIADISESSPSESYIEETKEEIPDEPRTRGEYVYSNTLTQLIKKLSTVSRNQILFTAATKKQIEKAFSRNITLQDALKKLFKDRGFDLTSTMNSQSGATSQTIVNEIMGMDTAAQQMLMNEIAEIFNNDPKTQNMGITFNTRDMTPAEQPKIQEPDPEQMRITREKVLEQLNKIMPPSDALDLYHNVILRANAIRLAKYSKNANWEGSDAETNKAILKIVNEEVSRIRAPNINTSKVFKILRDNIQFLNIIPDSAVNKFPDLRMPTTSTSYRDTELEKKAREVIRQAGLQTSRAGQALAGFGSYTISTSRALSNRLLRELPFNKKGDLDPNKKGYGRYDPIFGGDPDDPDDPDDGPEEVTFRDSTGRIQTVKLSYKQLLALLSAIGLVGGSIKLASKPGENPDKPVETPPSSPSPSDEGGEDSGDIPKKESTLQELYDKMGVIQNELIELDQMIAKGRKYGANDQYMSLLFNELQAKELQYSIVQDAIVAKQTGETDEGGGGGIPPDGGDEGDEKDDPDTEITPPQPIPIEPTDTSEGVRIAQYVDPAEVNLFVSTDAQAREEQKRWEEFSRVLPGFGLGGPRVNPLAAVNAEYYKKQFQNPNQTRKLAKPSIWKKPRGTIYNQPQLINIYDGYEHGKVQFEQDDYQTNRFMSSTLYDPYQTSNSNYQWNHKYLYHPEHKLAQFRYGPTNIPEVRTQPGFEGIPFSYIPSNQNNNLVGPEKTGVRDAPTYRNDNFSDRPKKVNSNIANFKQNLRVKSTRNR